MSKKQTFFILILITLIAIALRLINLDKQEGMWNDEYLTWEIAKTTFGPDFFEAILRNCHAPLHYIYLKIWMYFFGDTDYSLRLSSLVPGILGIIMMFFTSRLIKNKPSNSSGLIAAGFCAISSFLIYFSQEVRIYSLLFLLSAVHTYFALRTLDNPNLKNCVLFALSAFFVMLEHTIGFVYIFFSSLGVIFFANKKPKFQKRLIYSLLIAFLIFIPVGIFLFNVMFNQQYFSQWWAPFSLAKLGFFFTDLFSACIINITNAPPSFLSVIQNENGLNFGFILFGLIPLAIALICIFRAMFKFDLKMKYCLLTFFGMYLTVFAASYFNKIIFLTKYMTEIYPPLILLAVCGFVSFKSKSFKIILATVYCVLSLFFILVSPLSPVKLARSEGQNIPVVMLKALDYKNTDKILFLYYPKERFLKYNPEIKNNSNISHISKYNFTLISDNDMSVAFKNGKQSYRNIFKSAKNPNLDLFLAENIFNKIKKGEKFFLVDFAPVAIFSNEEFQNAVGEFKKYEKIPFLYLVFSYVRNYIVKQTSEVLSYSGVVSHLDWRIYIFEKT